jgi:hypothetical protein
VLGQALDGAGAAGQGLHGKADKSNLQQQQQAGNMTST